MAAEKDVREVVREAYGAVAREVAGCCGAAAPASCCGGSQGKSGDSMPGLLSERDAERTMLSPDFPVPEADLGLSCGDPVAFAEIRPGDVVLDLGSGAGKDVFLAAARTGPAGRVVGVDITPEMLDLARRHSATFTTRTGLANLEFREGAIEALPVDDASVDLVISNCVINLSPDKAAVFREVHRVLRPGGRMVVSDIVLERPLPDDLKTDALYAACIAGALPRDEYLAAIRSAGFENVEILMDRLYDASGACCDPVTSGVADDLKGIAASLTVRAAKGAAEIEKE